MAQNKPFNHTASPNQPTTIRPGDEWYNVTTDQFYKAVAVNGVSVEFVEIAQTALPSANSRARTLNFVIDGGGSLLTAGSKGYAAIDFNASIDQWYIYAGNATSTITVDVSKANFSTFPTFTASAGTSPSLTAAQKNYATPNWTGFTTVSAGDILQFTVSGTITNATRVTVSLKLTATS